PSRRVLGRSEARRQIEDAEGAIDQMFAAAGIEPAPCSRPSVLLRSRAASGDASAGEVDVLSTAVRDLYNARRDREEELVLQSMPIAGVLFLALRGSPGDRAELDPPLVLALQAVRATVDGWTHARRGSSRFGFIPFTEIDLLARRIDATIEIARRSGAG